MASELDQLDARLLDLVQREFPLCPRPFDEIGKRLGHSAAEVVERLRRLKNEGIVRQISAIFDSAALGYRSALVAFRVRDDALDTVAVVVSAHPGVSHCYARDASYNLWFTITVGPEGDIEREVAGLAEQDGVESTMLLPALKVYKIGVFLSMTDETARSTPSAAGRTRAAVPLSGDDRAAVRALQEDMPLVDEPFEELAAREGLTGEWVLDAARRFIEDGVMRRFAAVLRHTNAGYRANAMVCWNVSAGRADEVGVLFASNPAVSHCYERPSSPEWPYALYTMVHCRTHSGLDLAIEEMARVSEVGDYRVLRSLKEHKKSRVSYFKKASVTD